MARIVFTGINGRSVSNWSPVLAVLASHGHSVKSLFFPHRADPDSQPLARTPFPNIGTLSIENLWNDEGRAMVPEVGREAARLVRSERPDALILTCCHVGPELALACALNSDETPPVIIGCQHGFAQKWSCYWDNFYFDRLFLFGTHFLETVPSEFQDNVFVAGLSKLDAIEPKPRPPFKNDARQILFAAQFRPTQELIRFLATLPRTAGRPVVIRPHPEHVDAFDELRGTLPFVTPDEPLVTQLERSSLLLTTGSTSVLEALAAAVPVVVLPEQEGTFYETSGLVTDRLDAKQVLELATLQDTPQYRTRLNAFLYDVASAPGSGRAAVAAAEIERLIDARGAGSLTRTKLRDAISLQEEIVLLKTAHARDILARRHEIIAQSRQVRRLQREVDRLERVHQSLLSATSWKITAPLRAVTKLLGR